MRKIIIIIAILFSFAGFFLYLKNKDSYLPFIFWIESVAFCFLYLATLNNSTRKISFTFFKKQKEIIVIFLIALWIRFQKITEIPILTHDEARDSGLLPQKVLSGEITDFFGFYAGINHFFFFVASFPHVLFSNPIIEVRFLSAFLGAVNAILIYVFMKKAFSKLHGLVAAFLIAAYHVHIHFSRTEFLNLMDSFYATLILLVVFLYIKARNKKTFLLVALTLGFGLHFYSGLRALILMSLIFIIVISLKSLKSVKWIVNFFLFAAFFIISTGPIIIVAILRPVEFLAKGNAGNIAILGFPDNALFIAKNYIHSLLGYVYTPIDFHYEYGGPFLILPLSIFFIIGLIVFITKPKNFLYLYILLSLFSIPFFNSAILENQNYTHRLMSVVPFVIILLTVGLVKIHDLINSKSKSIAISSLLIFLTLYLIYNLNLYFIDNIWKKTLVTAEFRSWEIQKEINKSPNYKYYFCGDNSHPSFKSVPALEYMTQDTTLKDSCTIPSDRQDPIIFFVMPNSNFAYSDGLVSEKYSENGTLLYRIHKYE